MQILSVTLKNFKSHRDQHFTFAAGTNAICGENGAGKTSILEAIAWVLFTYQGSYAKDDLIRNGSGSAEVTVDFVSSLDGRTYAVERHSNKGYTLYDPQLDVRLPYTRIKDEVQPWLREHMGVPPGTDLGELFARTVGVPQGTFTADFLQATESRKAVFDRILKVEEYKTVHRDLNSLRRYAEDRVAVIEQEIAICEERLTSWDELKARHQTLSTELAQNQAQLTDLTQQLETLQQEQDALKAQADRIQQLQTQKQQAQAQTGGKQQAIALLQQSLQQAVQAAAICTETRPAYDAYQTAENELKTLAQQQKQRQTVQKRQRQLQKTLASRATDLARLAVQIEGFQAAAEQMAQLQPQIATQEQIETQLQQLQQEQTRLARVQGKLQATQNQSAQLTKQIGQTQKDIERLQGLADAVAQVPDLEQQRDRLQQQLSRIEAARQFEADLQQLVNDGQATGDRHQSQTQTALQTLTELQQSIPLLSADSVALLQAALEAGVQVNQAMLRQIQQILADLAAQTDADSLKSQLASLRRQLTALAEQQTTFATLPERQQQLTQLREQQQNCAHQIQELQRSLAQSEDLQRRLAEVQTSLTNLEDPRGRVAMLTRSQQQQPAVQKRHGEMQAAQAGIQRQIDDLETQIQVFNELETAVATQTGIKQTHQANYQQYLQYERAAQDQTRLTAELATAEQAIAQLQQETVRLQTDLQSAQVNFDSERAQQVNATYQTVRSQRDQLTGSLPQQQQLLQELQRQIDALKEVAEQRDKAIQERKKRDRIRRFINFARKAYKEAGPRITERYVQQISREADRLFRDLLNRPNVALTWTRDYEIQVQEGPNARRFVNLSGGEQMCAALAVRLALLKVLADIDIAFFDEPTTNMDRPRRESLAEAIARIKNFNQLFVISHDDTFEKVTENVIFVEREEGA